MISVNSPLMKGLCLTSLGVGLAAQTYMFFKQGVYADQGSVDKVISTVALAGCLLGGSMLAIGGFGKFVNGGAY